MKSDTTRFEKVTPPAQECYPHPASHRKPEVVRNAASQLIHEPHALRASLLQLADDAEPQVSSARSCEPIHALDLRLQARDWASTSSIDFWSCEARERCDITIR